jgi:hypothetical protein
MRQRPRIVRDAMHHASPASAETEKRRSIDCKRIVAVAQDGSKHGRRAEARRSGQMRQTGR